MGINVSFKCDRCGAKWEKGNFEDNYVDTSENTLYIPSPGKVVGGERDIILCDKCMAEYNAAYDDLRFAFGTPIVRESISVDQIKVEGFIRSDEEIAYNQKRDMEKYAEMRRIQQNVKVNSATD